MIRILKKLVIPTIIVILFAFAYLVVVPYIQRRNLKEQVFNDFEKELSNLNYTYTKEKIDAKEFGAWKAYSYLNGGKIVRLYVFNKDSREYDSALENGMVKSLTNDENYLYGIFYGHCCLYISVDVAVEPVVDDTEFDEKLLNAFATIASKYENSL